MDKEDSGSGLDSLLVCVDFLGLFFFHRVAYMQDSISVQVHDCVSSLYVFSGRSCQTRYSRDKQDRAIRVDSLRSSDVRRGAPPSPLLCCSGGNMDRQIYFLLLEVVAVYPSSQSVVPRAGQVHRDPQRMFQCNRTYISTVAMV